MQEQVPIVFVGASSWNTISYRQFCHFAWKNMSFELVIWDEQWWILAVIKVFFQRVAVATGKKNNAEHDQKTRFAAKAIHSNSS